MSVIASALKHMLAAGMPADAIVAAVAEMEANLTHDPVAEKRRAYDRERKRVAKENRSTGIPVDSTESVESAEACPFPAPAPFLPPYPQQTPTPTHTPVREPRARKGGFDLPDRIPADAWAGWLEMRKRIGKPATDRAKQLAIVELDRLSADGWPPGEVLNHCTMNSYQGIFPPKGSKNERTNPHRPANDEIRDPMVRAILARQAERAAGRGVEHEGHAGDWP